MKPMFREQVLPKLTGPLARRSVILRARVNCFGPGESAAEALLGDVTARGRDPEVGITVHEATITLRIVARGETVDEAQRKIDATKQLIYARMGDTAFGEEDDELEHVVLRMLARRGQTLATVECGTRGGAAWRLAAAQGLNAPFVGGVVAPTAAGCALRLGLPADSPPPRDDAPRAAEFLADACRARCASDFGLASSESVERRDPQTGEAYPAVVLALADAQGVSSHELNLAGDPAIQHSRAAKALLNLLRLSLLRPPVAKPAAGG